MSGRDLINILIFTALTIGLGLFPPLDVPLIGVPITAQTLGVMLSGLVLGSWRGALSQMLMVGLVMAGAPLLAGGRGGFDILLSPTGGFLLGWIPGAFVAGWLTEHRPPGWMRHLSAAVVGGVGLVYLIGVPWMVMVSGVPAQIAISGSAIFIPGDLIKAVMAAAIALTVVHVRPACLATGR
ncbi:biotin transporter BioY [Tistrella bauzanensis]|uniref:Biotin transporter n=1 Tax=Tistrella bauzanensis TaxID=657419 RepID=A0ABQ1IH77_9PROT|nr:biotin transporter BioY [Tistrella bauzanensis]GGB41328.1 biotin transporter BioY [Tistrella bauzanensis]